MVPYAQSCWGPIKHLNAYHVFMKILGFRLTTSSKKLACVYGVDVSRYIEYPKCDMPNALLKNACMYSTSEQWLICKMSCTWIISYKNRKERKNTRTKKRRTKRNKQITMANRKWAPIEFVYGCKLNRLSSA